MTEEEKRELLTETLRDYLEGLQETIGNHQESIKWFKDFDSDFMQVLEEEQTAAVDLPMIKHLKKLAEKVNKYRRKFEKAVEVFETEVENARGFPEAQISYFVPKDKRAKTEDSAPSNSDASDSDASDSDASDSALSHSDASD